jgi:hypothetical protein
MLVIKGHNVIITLMRAMNDALDGEAAAAMGQ